MSVAPRAEKDNFANRIRQGDHTVLSDGSRILTIPRPNPVNAYTMGVIVRDAGLSAEEFRKLL